MSNDYSVHFIYDRITLSIQVQADSQEAALAEAKIEARNELNMDTWVLDQAVALRIMNSSYDSPDTFSLMSDPYEDRLHVVKDVE